MKLRLVRVTSPSDFTTTVPIEFAAFHADTGHNAMLGLPNPTTIAHLIADHTKDFLNCPEDCWVKVVDDDDADGRFVAMGWWKVYPTFVPSEYEKKWREVEGLREQDFEFLKGGEDGEGVMQDALKTVKMFIGKRVERIHEPHIHLQLLFVDPAYHRKGAGKMLLDWGTKLADHLMIPIWVETSKEGKRLYDSFGFERIEEISFELQTLPPIEYPLRRRPVKASGL